MAQEAEAGAGDDRRQDGRLEGVEPPALQELPLGGGDLARLLRGFDEQFSAASATGSASLLFGYLPAYVRPLSCFSFSQKGLNRSIS